MGTADKKRKNFRCVFNDYITQDNRDGVVQSILSQFRGYEADPEITLTDNGFILTLDTNDELTPTSVRDKILWNRFVERVTTQDSIRKVQIIRLPQAGILDFGKRVDGTGSVGGFGPDVDPIVGDTGVDEKLHITSEHPAKTKIDGGTDPRILGETASVHYADVTDVGSEGQVFVKGLTPQDLSSDVTSMENKDETTLESGRKIPRIFGFKVVSFQSDTGGSFTMTKPNGMTTVNPDPSIEGTKADSGTGIGGGAAISAASFFVYDPKNAQGTELGAERNRGDNPGFFSFSNKQEEVEDDKNSVELPQARGGGQAVPDGGQVEGWYASSFGLNETYDYLGDADDYEF